MWYLNNLIMLISKAAYINIAIKGYDMCDSSSDIRRIIEKRGKQYILTKMIGMAVRFMGLIIISVGNGAFMFLMLNHFNSWNNLAANWLNPCIAAMLIGFIIFQPIMNLYNMASETIILCLLTDLEMGRPKKLRSPILKYFLPKEEEGVEYSGVEWR